MAGKQRLRVSDRRNSRLFHSQWCLTRTSARFWAFVGLEKGVDWQLFWGAADLIVLSPYGRMRAVQRTLSEQTRISLAAPSSFCLGFPQRSVGRTFKVIL